MSKPKQHRRQPEFHFYTIHVAREILPFVHNLATEYTNYVVNEDWRGESFRSRERLYRMGGEEARAINPFFVSKTPEHAHLFAVAEKARLVLIKAREKSGRLYISLMLVKDRELPQIKEVFTFQYDMPHSLKHLGPENSYGLRFVTGRHKEN